MSNTLYEILAEEFQTVADPHTEDLIDYRDRIALVLGDKYTPEELEPMVIAKTHADKHITGQLKMGLPDKVSSFISGNLSIEQRLQDLSDQYDDRDSEIKTIAREIAEGVREGITPTKALTPEGLENLMSTCPHAVLEALSSDAMHKQGLKMKKCPFPHDIYVEVVAYLKSLYPYSS